MPEMMFYCSKCNGFMFQIFIDVGANLYFRCRTCPEQYSEETVVRKLMEG
jgi:DNA-directed RNA polymerase subunit M/transcription elongation factor TFIIS